MENKKYEALDIHIRKGQNRIGIRCYITICIIMEIAYIVEVAKGNRTMGYFSLFSLFVLVPCIISYVMYRRNKQSTNLRYAMSAGYMILYAFVMFTGSTTMVYAYVMPFYVVVVLFFELRLSVMFAVVSILINAAEITYHYVNGMFDTLDITSAEIQMAAVLLLSVFLVIMCNFIEKTNAQKLALIEDERAQAESANKSKSEFLSNMSHEMRTPLNAIIGMNEMLMRGIDDPELFEYATMVQNSSSALLAIINDVLDISKIEAGKIELVNEEYNISSVFVDSYQMIRQRGKDKNLKLNFTFDETMPKLIVGDMVRVRQIFVNILTNAVKYTNEGSVTASLTGKRVGDVIMLKFTVADTGIGMTPENVAKLFDKFERFDMKQNRTIEGTGLGMAITKQLLDLMNGKIEVESEYGKGSTFTITIPQDIAEDTAVGEVDMSTQVLTAEAAYYQKRFTAPKARILVVDDVESNIKVVRALLKDTKIKIDAATSGREAIELACKKKYEIIFMDHMMPDMDGIETLTSLKENPENKNVATPVIMLTANALAGEKEKYLAAGFNDYLTKPIRPDKLEGTIAYYLPVDKVNFGDVPGEEETSAKEAVSETAEETSASKFDAIVGLNLEDGLKYCAGSEDFLWEMLLDFKNNGRYEKIQELYMAGDWENYRIEVHALKGTARTVGLTEFGDVTEKIEKAVKGGDIIFAGQNHDAMMAKFDEILKSIKDEK